MTEREPAAATESRKPIHWGFAGVYPGELGVYQGDVPLNKLDFVARHGFSVAPVALKELMDTARLEQFVGKIEEHGLRTTTGLGVRVFERPLEEVRAEVDERLALIGAAKDRLRLLQVHFCVGPYHRFQRDPSLAAQLGRLREVFEYTVPRLADLGLPLGIENHGDYYLSDLIPLCEQVPGLGILMDTGNCFLIGERPVEACRAAAPFTIGTHFKDHRVAPRLQGGLAFEIGGAALGDGDVGLEEIFADLMRLHPDPENLVLEIEWVPNKEEAAFESLDRSKRFLEKLGAPAFRYPSAISAE